MRRARYRILLTLLALVLVGILAWPETIVDGGLVYALTSGRTDSVDAVLLAVDRLTPSPTATNPRIPTFTPTPSPTITQTPSRFTPTFTRTMTNTPPERTPTPTGTQPADQTPTPTPTRPAGCEYLVADFEWTAFCAISLTFNDRSATSPSDPINSWHWDFGDGASSTLQNPTHTFNPPGAYEVTLTVRTRNDCEASVRKQVQAVYPEWVIHKELVSPVGRPVYVGDEVTYRLVVGAVPPNSILDYNLYDLYDTGYFEFVSASPAPDYVKPAYGSSMLVAWEKQGSIPAGDQREYYVTLRVKAEIGPPVDDRKCNQVWALLTFAPDDCRYSVYAQACVEAGPRPSGLILTKTLLEPASGVAQVGDVVTFMLEARNLGTTPIPRFDVRDTFLDAQYGFVFASPAPTQNTSDGTNHTLMWDNLSLGPGGAFVILLELRAKMPGVLANCARPVEWVEVDGVFTVLEPIPGPESCASVQAQAPEGKHFSVWKKFTQPSNHVAALGDWVSFVTECTITGSEPAVRLDLFDHITPPSVSSVLPLQFGFLWAFQPGDWAKVGAAFKPKAVALPAVNTAEWTATWADGTKDTQAAQDYVYIVDGTIGKGLFIDKWLGDPLPSAAISDTLTFHMAITNVTGIDLPVLPLEDTFPAQCLRFLGASVPPDHALPGKLVWNNIGPLPLGESIRIDVQFHADAVCPAALNCASSTYSLPGVAPQTVAGCAAVTIRGDQPRLVVNKQRTSPSPAHVGAPVTWQIVLENAGTAPLAIVPLHDAYQSAFLEYQSAVPAPDHIDLAHGRLDWNNLGPLAPGQSIPITLTLLAKAPGAGVLNCAESSYSVGSSTFTPYQCASVDIVARGPAISVAKELAWPEAGKPLAVGEVVAFTITLRNTGPVTLTNVVVEDNFDSGCLSFVPGGAMPPLISGPGQLRWTFPSLVPGETHSWRVQFRACSPCAPTHNCAIASGEPPEGPPVAAEACVPLAIEPLSLGLAVRKAMVAPAQLPLAGDVVQFEIVVRNTGNTSLATVDVTDEYDPSCLEYANATPIPDSVHASVGKIYWNNVGPLGPGDVRVLSVFLRVTGACPHAVNCSEARWLVGGVPELSARDCVELVVRAGAVGTPTPTATWPPGEPTPTPTATREGEVRRLYLAVVLKTFV